MTERYDMYLDHAAATPCDEMVVAAMQPFFRERFFNPSSPYAPAIQVRRRVEEARHVIAQTIGAQASDCTITAGATESINLAMTAGRNGHVVTTAIEHHAVLAAAKQYRHTIVDVSAKGAVAVEAIEAAIRPDTTVVSVALANNELGTIQPVSTIATMLKKIRTDRLKSGTTTPLWLHCDASQGVGQIDINVARLGVDMLTLNSGKLYGPKQVGLLWHTPSVRLQPLIVGGGQETGLRSGTENVAGVIGFSVALERAHVHRHGEAKRLRALRDELQRRLEDAFPDMVVSGDQKRRLPSHLHVAFPGLDGERLVFRLENRQVFVATGSACAANSGTGSHVLQAIGADEAVRQGSLRLSLGHQNTASSISTAADILIEEIRAEYARIAS
jgi:cysteine desulfurase